jgi:hypothetical protein
MLILIFISFLLLQIVISFIFLVKLPRLFSESKFILSKSLKEVSLVDFWVLGILHSVVFRMG